MAVQQLLRINLHSLLSHWLASGHASEQILNLEIIYLGGHNEIIYCQALAGVGPEAELHLVPILRSMPDCFGQLYKSINPYAHISTTLVSHECRTVKWISG